MNCLGYIRVSTERQAGELLTSLADQEAAILNRAERLGLSVGHWYRDEGASGATVEKRPAFMAMLDFCKLNERAPADPGTILVLNDSRFGRFPDPEEAAYWRHHFRRLGWVVRFVEGDESEDQTARTVMRAIGSAQATEYRENIKRNAKRGMKGAAEQGFWTREAPFGYRRQVVYPESKARVLERRALKAPDEKVKLTPHEEEASIVLWAFESYASGKLSGSGLARELQKRVTWRKWSPHVVHTMLRNPAYMGDVLGGVRSEQEEYGKRDAHPAIVSRNLWHAAQQRLEKNQKLGHAVRTDYLLTGLLTCPHCGESYTGGGGGKSRDAVKVREFRRFYRDSGGAAGNCPGRIGTVMRHIVDEATLDTLAETIGAPALQRQIEQEIDRVLSGSVEGAGASKRQLEATRRKVTERRERIIALLADGTLLRDEAAPQLEALRVELADVESRLEQVRFQGRRARASTEERNRVVALAQDFPRRVKALHAAGKGQALRELVEPWLEAATFDKISRVLTLNIRPVPSFLLVHSPGRG